MLLLLLTSATVRGQDSPILATIGDNGAPVHGGPDEIHYQTSHLEPEAEVEIYRLDPGRWCAIRPPVDSFSLVRAAAIESLDEASGIGTIAADDEQCWIGTMMGQVDEPMWQLKLKRGERVHVLGTIASTDDPTQAEWIQVAPPPGEFRWIRWSDLDESSQQRALEYFERRPGADTESEAKTILRRERPMPPAVPTENFASPQVERGVVTQARYDERDEPRKTAQSTQPNGKWRQPQRRRSFGDVSLSSASIANNVTPFVAPDPTRRMEATPPPSTATQTSPQGPTIWPRPFQELDLRLSMEILKEPGQWQLDSIAADVMKTKQSAVPSDAAIADHLLSKIRQFQSIQGSAPRATANSGPAQIQGVVAVVGQEAIPLLRISPDPTTGTGADYSKTFDAYGWLNELVRDEGMGQTTFVLQDDSGKITHLVAATPGLNLHRYLKTKIGIVGQKGFHQSMNLDHVTAERIVNLDTVRR